MRLNHRGESAAPMPVVTPNDIVIITTRNAVIKVVREPAKRLLNTSRPSTSVPNRCAHEGFASDRSGLISSGSNGVQKTERSAIVELKATRQIPKNKFRLLALLLFIGLLEILDSTSRVLHRSKNSIRKQRQLSRQQCLALWCNRGC